tara:strand:+ start:40950 stop:41987 length:1038 start_codon:yes stop_codon:yes gene_type:complete
MSPQFVDFNGDGHLDIVAGIFDGSPHVALGDGTHWQQPHTILDKAGERVVLNSYWDFTKKQWVKTDRCDPEGGAPAEGHLTSAIAMDWDHDGDFDLVLGDHKSGYVYLRRNEGSNQAPLFALRNELVTADGKAIHDPGTIANVRAIDWNNDGQLDLMVSGMGDPYGTDTGGGVAVYLNQADSSDRSTQLGAAISLIPNSKKVQAPEPSRPDVGLHPEAVDFDGDGDLDLIVGGYSQWTPAGPELNAEQTAELAAMRAQLEAVTKQSEALYAIIKAGTKGLDAEAYTKKYAEIYDSQRDQHAAIAKQRQELSKSIDALAPLPKRVSFTWLYENLTVSATEKSTGQR